MKDIKENFEYVRSDEWGNRFYLCNLCLREFKDDGRVRHFKRMHGENKPCHYQE